MSTAMTHPVLTSIVILGVLRLCVHLWNRELNQRIKNLEKAVFKGDL